MRNRKPCKSDSCEVETVRGYLRRKRFGLVTVAALMGTMLAFIGCAPQQGELGASAGKGGDAIPAVTADWSMQSDCSMCHTTEKASADDGACLASQHKDVACVTCHTDEPAMETVHEGATADGKMPKRLKKTEVANDSCLSCHFGTVEELAAQTPDIPKVVDTEGTEVNPHAALAMEQHTSGGKQLECGSCHKMHEDSTAEEESDLACQSCHHAGVFTCYTCHD